MFAIFVLILDQDPDPALTRFAQRHFLQMVAQNRIFGAG